MRQDVATRQIPPWQRPGVSAGPVGISAGPIGPSGPLRQVYPVLPLLGPPKFSLTRITRYGRGVVVPVNAAASTPVVVTHNLGRAPTGVIALQNNAGATQNPNLTLNAGASPTRTQATISGDQTMANCFVWFF